MIRCIKFRPHVKNTLRAFIDLELTRVGLILHDCGWHTKNGDEWVTFPARWHQGEDGVRRWAPLVEFAAGAKRERESFQRQAIAAIREYAEDAEPAS